jgi:nucleotide-binding universal stress UspA family protein
MMPHPLGVLIAFSFFIALGATLFWMLRLPRPLPQDAARAIYSVHATRCILVPILDLFATGRAVELACRLGRAQGATIVLAYVFEVPMVLALDAPLSPEAEEGARAALAQADHIARRHGVHSVATTVRARAADEGIRRAVQTYQSDMVILGVESREHRVTTVLMRTADALLRRLPCEVLIDSVPA